VDSLGGVPISRYIGLSVLALGFIVGLVLFVFTQWYGGEAASVGFGMLVFSVFFGGMLGYFVISMRQGKVHAIISNEGIAVRENSFNIIPWENIHSIKREVTKRGRRRNDSGNIGVTVRYVNESGNMHKVRFSTFYSNFADEAEAIEAINKFRDNLKTV
jgi:hypothetical protein